ncbi:Proteoglycan 4 [Triplophysa tibetana]|uniref:Proteoglycan 4 n=1 Tax=Triplophysa tibetana TaxID=1572043 RepID=A0A5A9NFP7_9TELE|nr:Proteoglycan 4 [Triplophysa tibetana]
MSVMRTVEIPEMAKYLSFLLLFTCASVSCSNPRSCQGRCGQGYYKGSLCQCDYECLGLNECCSDFEDLCTTRNSCKGRCGEPFNRGNPCHCDIDCTSFNQCCSDYESLCLVEESSNEDMSDDEEQIAPVKTSPSELEDTTSTVSPEGPTITVSSEVPSNTISSQGPTTRISSEGTTTIISSEGTTAIIPTDGSSSTATEGSTSTMRTADSTSTTTTEESTSTISSERPTTIFSSQGTTTIFSTVSSTSTVPTEEPTTTVTDSPTSTLPTEMPTSVVSTEDPTSTVTTESPKSTVPTEKPSTATTDSPISTAPTEMPTSIVSTEEPTSTITTESPISTVPTEKPTTTIIDSPTSTATTEMPTSIVSTEDPTTTVTTESSLNTVPTEEPTSTVTTESPTSTVPTELPKSIESTEDPTSTVTSESPTSTVPTESTASTAPRVGPASTILTPGTALQINPTKDSLYPKDLSLTGSIKPTKKPTKPSSVNDKIDFQSDDYDTDLCSGRPISGLTTLKNGTMVAFRGHYFWTLDKERNPDPARLIKSVWGIPSPIDTVFTRCNCQGNTYFFKGNKYWRFEDGTMDPGYPKPINQGFGQINHITAALSIPQYRSRNEVVIFFKRGGQAQKYTYQVTPSCGSKPAIPSFTVRNRFRRDLDSLGRLINISQTWRGFPSVVTSAISVPSRVREGYKYYVFSKETHYSMKMEREKPVVLKSANGQREKTANSFFKCPQSKKV